MRAPFFFHKDVKGTSLGSLSGIPVNAPFLHRGGISAGDCDYTVTHHIEANRVHTNVEVNDNVSYLSK